MKHSTTWVLVADAGRARILVQSGPDKSLSPVESLSFEHALPKSSDIARDSLPRTFDSIGPGRHAIAPKSDPQRSEKLVFARELAQVLETGLTNHAYDKLIIVAPPQMIGDMRANLSDAVRRHLERELVADLTHASNSDIAQRIAEI
jgi:protein required for attachment to host cells